jgi:hypothetical protein
MTSSIALVLDPAFGPRLGDLARRMPVWIVSSVDNDIAIAIARREGAGPVTTLFVRKEESKRETLLRALCDIDEHHGPASSASPYTELLVYGGAAEVLLPDDMRELGLAEVKPLPDGFRASKRGANAEHAHVK